jgi:predicted DNA-binding transcriptional regulator YafY
VSRSERLLALLQALRRHRRPVSGKLLAAELGISVRTPYSDIGSLQAQGAHIEGATGLGYVLRPGFMLPPLMFAEDEIEALVLGSSWVADRADPALAMAARNALAKIAAVLPVELSDLVDTSSMLVGPAGPAAADGVDLAAIRRAIRSERKLDISYRDGSGAVSQRTVWPFALGFFERARGRRVVRIAAGFPAFSHRPDCRRERDGGAVSPPSPSALKAMARGRGIPPP